MARAVIVALVAAVSAAGAAEVSKVEHPFLLWTKQDLAALREKVKTEPWAKAAYEAIPAGRGSCEEMRNLFRYAVTGDRQAGDAEKKKLLGVIDSPHPLGAAMEFRVLAYDLLYDELSAQQRAAIETKFREYIRYAIKPGGTYDANVYNNALNYARYDGENGKYTRTNWLPNIIFPWKLSANLMAAALRDEDLIRRTWATHGSIRWYLDEYLGDMGFYEEEFSKMGSTPGALLMCCTALRNLGLEELGFGHKGAGGATVRGHIASVIHMTFPGVDTGTDRWRFERMSAGDVRPWLPFQHATVEGYFANGEGGDKMWQAPGAWGGTKRGKEAQWDGYSNFTPKMNTRLWLEWGHRLWPDAGLDWFLARMRAPDEKVYTPTLYFGIDPIDPDKTKPPPIRSQVYPDRGFAMLRAQEGPGHWTSPAPAVCLRLTAPYAHHVNDQLVLCGFYAFNRPIYQNPKSDPGYAFKFSRSIRSHAGVMIDGHVRKDDWGKTGSVEPSFTDDCVTRQDFSEDVKFVAARTRKRYPGVDETRALMLTREYLLDVSTARGDVKHSYVWLVHSYGKAAPDEPARWKPSDDLGELVKELTAVRTLDTAGRPWSVTVRQAPPEQQPENTPLGAKWWARKVGVRVHMLGQDGAKAHVAAPPVPAPSTGKPPEKTPVDGVTVASSLWAPSATFAALHEPFEAEPKVASFQRVAQTPDALAVRVTGAKGSGIDDRLMVRVGDKAGEPATLNDAGESFTFAGHAFLRVAADKVVVRGDMRAMAVRVGGASPRLVVNGQELRGQLSDGLLTWARNPTGVR
jgi:hypothetical protein